MAHAKSILHKVRIFLGVGAQWAENPAPMETYVSPSNDVTPSVHYCRKWDTSATRLRAERSLFVM